MNDRPRGLAATGLEVPQRAVDVLDLFRERVESAPSATAVSRGAADTSYRELDERSNQVAAALVCGGAERGTIVAILLGDPLDRIVAILGCLKAGCVFAALDATHPAGRLQHMLDTCAARWMILDASTATLASVLLQGREGAAVVSMGAVTLLADRSTDQLVEVLDATGYGTDRVSVPTLPDDPCYVYFTSGSTGRPKGIVGRIRGLAHFIQWEMAEFGLGPGSRISQLTGPAFDVYLRDVFAALCSGGTVCIPPGAGLPGPALADWIEQARITLVHCVPSVFRLLLASDPGPDRFPALRFVLLAGESLAPADANAWIGRFGARARLVNLYGPTETTLAKFFHRLPATAVSGDFVPIGKPMPGSEAILLDAGLAPCAPGEIGELFIRTPYRTLGYCNAPELTAAAFISNPCGTDPGDLVYRTGDLVQQLPDGSYRFVGRKDFQVKIRGNRIEPGEIEARLRECPGVREAVVVAREDRPGDVRLVAYYVPDGSGVMAPDLRARLAASLPDYMVPAFCLPLDRLPLSANGKIDRAALPAPGTGRPDLAVAYAGPASAGEARVCEAFAGILGIERVGRLDNFFDLGGNSMLALQLLARLQEDSARPLPATLVYSAPTPAALAAGLARSEAVAIGGQRFPSRHPAASGASIGQAPTHEPVAIIAMAGRFPGAGDVEAFWDNLCAGRESITVFPPETLDPSIPLADRMHPCYVAARGVIDGVEEFDAGFFGISPREAELMDPQHRIFLELCWECMERGGEVPGATAGPVGVFAGTYHSTYLRRHVAAHPDLVAKVGAYQVTLANEKDYIATRIAHKLDLTGPAISLYTACSTSLVAICQAVDSLRAGACDMALAGGSSIVCPPRTGHIYQEGAMFSPDGRTRTFDAAAHGTVFSDGAAVVLLKRLPDAIRDGNPVHAVIRGGAVNNDGGAKASFTAPSSDGQAAVIAMAQARAGVSPRSIGYLEAHGTATPMGDPIEIEGLVKAFRLGTPDSGFCRIGSVKSNVGHLVIAAGAAGVIKTALALEQRKIPPSLNFERPNPAIDFSASPFVVNAVLGDWSHAEPPLRAGVSSFGVGGTNAHVVLEEAPVLPVSQPAAGSQLLALSARTPAALLGAAGRLADFLERESDRSGGGNATPPNLADVAWTLAVGRKPFAHRVTIVAGQVEEAITRLRSAELAAAIGRGRPVRNCETVFMFPGQGSHYAGMGRALHEGEPEFAEAFDACADILDAAAGMDLHGLAFGDDPAALLPTAVMQPAIFAIEYALARLWMARGVVPVAMIGHSVGEFVAATLAGVFTLPDALRLVARRGALMQAQPAGGMLSVRMALEPLLDRLPPTLALAAENAPGACVVAGPVDAIAAFKLQLDESGVACRVLLTSHAFHSAMMDPVVAPFQAEIEAVERSAPTLPLVSTATGDWLDVAQAMSPQYWARHLREPVRFAAALGRVIDSPARVLLEVGPRTTLATLARQHPALQRHDTIAVASLADAPGNEASALRLAAGQLWSRGTGIDLAGFDHRSTRRRVRLPTYPFERKRYWVEAAPAVDDTVATRLPAPEPLITADASATEPHPEPAAADAAAADMSPDTGPGRHDRLLAQLGILFTEFTGIGITDDAVSTRFVELGLDSLMLTQAARILQDRFDARITFRQLMGECGSLELLAGWLDRQLPAEASESPGTAAGERPGSERGTLIVPSTGSQQEIWLADQLGREASLAFNLSVSLRLRGTLDRQALRAALQELVARHDALRSHLGPDGQVLYVHEHRELHLQVHDLRGLDDEGRRLAIDGHLRDTVETPFDLASGPLFRAGLLHVSDNDHLLLMTAHHIVCDGWSWGVIVRELAALYGRHMGVSDAPLSEPALFSDFAKAEAERDAEATEADVAYWLSCFPGDVPVLDLPVDRPRPQRRSFASARVDHTLDAALLAAVRSMGARRGASLFATLLAAFSTLLSRLSRQSDVVVGIPAAGQPSAGQADLVGHCVNTLPLRFGIDPSQSFAHAVEAAQASLLDALEHQGCTFGTLLRRLRIGRDPARIPLVSVMFNLERGFDDEGAAFPGLVMEAGSAPRSFETFELFVNAAQVHGELRLECQYNRDLYDAGTVRRWLRAYETLLRAAVGEPSAELGSLPLVDPVAQAELASLQPVPVAFDRECRMHEYFERQCDRAPDRVAVRFGASMYSYAALEERANRIAHLLRRHGVRRGALVGLALDRGFDMLASVLGVLKAGAGYVPLDPGFPHERLAYMAADAGLAALLTTRAHAAVFDPQGRAVLSLDALDAGLAAMPSTRIGRDEGAAEPEGVAYVIYTSGSTGRPKGVQVPHRAVSNFLTGMRHEPGIGAGDRLLAVTTLSFDIAVLELLLPLSVGAMVVLADREAAADGAALSALLVDSRATVMQGTPSTWRMLLEAGWTGVPGFTALCGGEPLPPDLATQLLPRCDALWNLYGPTETTVWSTVARIVPAAVEEGTPDIGIGHPIANTRVWILDPRGGLCPCGVSGEIAIGGEGVTLGYLDRPELTAARFLPDRFSTDLRDGPALLYLTGDLGRWRADGRLEHQGRLDFQVKIRGHRIELGEVEAVLAQCPGVARVTAVAREDRPGDVRLVAYVVAQSGAVVDEAACMAHLRRQLPDYMVPQHLVALDAMPLLPNGKIDRGSLPAPSPPLAGGMPSRGPRSEAEERIAAIMAEVLGLPAVDVEADFFALGGHSLLGARLMGRIGRALGVQLPLRALFEASTVERLAELATAARQGQQAGGGDIPHHPDQSLAPLSRMQRRVWIQEQIQPGGAAYTIASAYRLTGPLDVRALESALAEVVRRQPTLRTELGQRGDVTVQRVLGHVAVSLPLEDLSMRPPEDAGAEATRRMVELSAQPIAMDRAPLFRACLYRLAADTHVFFFMVHHVVWDGVSQDRFCAGLAALYAAISEGRSAEPAELERSYVDFVHWHLARADSPEARTQLAYWTESLSGDLAPLQLPEDLPRPPVPTGRGGSESVRLDDRTLARLRQVGAGVDASLFMTLLAAYFAWLHRITGQEDLVVGVPVREHLSEAMDRVLGFFVNILPVRVQVAPDLSFLQLVERVRRAVLDCFTHPDVALEDLVQALGLRRDPGRNPIYQAVFSFQEAGSTPAWGAVACEPVDLPQTTATNDLALWCQADARGLAATLNYNADIILPESAARMRRGFEALLASAHTAPGAPVGDLDCVGAEDRRMLQEWNATSVPLEAPASVHAMVMAQLRATPSAAAIHFDGQVTNCSQLRARSERIASALVARGVAGGDLVGVCLDRDTDLVASMIGVLLAGAAYVPLDPAYPPDRLRFMAEDAGLKLVVSKGGLAAPLQWSRHQLLLLDADGAQIDSMPPPAGFPDVGPDAPAYVIYTSGSTGKPKGVRVPHGAVVNFLRSMRREPGISPSDRLLAVTTTSFDIAVLELFLPLAAGATIVLASREQVFDGAALARLLHASEATLLQATPSVWRLLLDSGWRARPGFKALCGGEPLPVDLARRLLAQGIELWNMYGPTETTVWSTCARVHASGDGGAPDIHIGRPIDNTTVWVLDARRQLCPPGVPGEIHIGGAGMSLGYHDRPELTAERFIPDPFPGVARFEGSTLPARLYRTGDRGRWRHDGVLRHEGRLDFQVKLRGHRIEPGEIETLLVGRGEVARALVMVREDRPGDERLVAYLVAGTGARIEEDALRGQLRGQLPAYMVPQHFVVLDAMPLLPNGKVDRSALPVPVAAAVQLPRGAEEATDPRVRYLSSVWSDLLGLPAGPDDNFFDLGGHSMLAVHMANRVERDTGVRIKLIRLGAETLVQVAEALPVPVAGQAPVAGLGMRLGDRFRRLLGRAAGSTS